MTLLLSSSARARAAFVLPVSLSPGVRKMAGSVSTTFLGQALLLGGLLLITRRSVLSFGAAGFGEYQVARRTLAVVAFPLMCGLGVSLPRFIARDLDLKINLNARRAVAGWLYGGGLLALVLLTVFLFAGTLLSPAMEQWIFGDAGEQGMMPSLLLAIAGMFCQTFVCAALRGLSRFRAAALWQVVNGAAVPLAAILFAQSQVPRALSLGGALWCGFGLLGYLRLCREWAPRPGDEVGTTLGLPGVLRTLLVFGAPRVPGDLALFGLFALPAYYAVHAHDLLGAGFLSVGLSLIQATGAVFASAGFVLLPYWSRAARSPDTVRIARKRMATVVVASATIAALAVCLLQLCLRPAARLLLGPLAEAGMHDLRIVVAGAVPYVLYLVLRDYYDALSVVPLNTLALCSAMLVEAALLRQRWLSIPAATAASFFALGAAMLALWAVSGRDGRPLHPAPPASPAGSL